VRPAAAWICYVVILTSTGCLADDLAEPDWAAAVWHEPGRIATVPGNLVLPADPVLAWPIDLQVRQAARLSRHAAGRLVVVFPANPSSDVLSRISALRTALPNLWVTAADGGEFSGLRRHAEAELAVMRSLEITGLTGAGGERLAVRSRSPRPGSWRLTALSPAELFGPEPPIVDLDGGAAMTLPVEAQGGRGDWWLLIEAGEVAAPVQVPVASHGVVARLVPGRHVSRGPSALPLSLTVADGPRRTARVNGGPGLPLQTAALWPGRETELSVPVMPPSAGFARFRSPIEIAVGAAVVRPDVELTSLPAEVAELRPVRVDGRLDDWRPAAWHAVENRGQVVVGAAAWRGPADAGLRWSAAIDAHRLILAWTVTDDVVGQGDAVELRWDAGVGEDGAPGEQVQRQTFGRAAAAGELGSGWWAEVAVPLTELGVAGQTWLGFDLALRDDDPGDGECWLAASGERWSNIDPARLGLLRVAPAGPAAVRWWVSDPGGGVMATGN